MAGNLLIRPVHICQIVLSSYGAYHSYRAITNLQKYEDVTKKAAKWSTEAENQLERTRTTQAAGAIAILASILAALLLVLLGPSLPTWLRFSISPALLVGVLFARGHIKNHWASHNGKTVGKRIPLPNMEGYNEAQRATEEVLRVLEWVEYGWVANTLVVGLLGSR